MKKKAKSHVFPQKLINTASAVKKKRKSDYTWKRGAVKVLDSDKSAKLVHHSTTKLVPFTREGNMKSELCTMHYASDTPSQTQEPQAVTWSV
ncbi:hypothetical protein BaRGS_00033939 [Batillaria attramentaria]|uniref:Uncharacterized protein n=1 Tax=Batillaria attramentaria TaxID=370345 RepID=A0ABD0JIR6_9CAEN